MSFKKDFIWGTATASYQVEGAAFEDGRGLSIWDTFSREPGRVFNGHNGDVACDHYHRFKEDVALMKQLGVKNYRFSLSWSRLIPEGVGAVNEKGVAFYNALIDELLANGIRPFITLFHWDYPRTLQAKGGWENPESPKWYESYVELVAKRFGDRAKDFITFNEPQCFIGKGFGDCEHAPGYKLPLHAIVPMSHHVLKAHGLGVLKLRELVPDCRVGYAPCGNPCMPATERSEDIEAARKAYFDVTTHPLQWGSDISWWSDPPMLGRYPEKGLQMVGHFLPKGWGADMELIHQPLDFYAQNIYNGRLFKAADNALGYEEVPFPAGHPKTAIQWMVTPDALYWGPKFLYERYKTPFLITENGMSCHDVVSLDGKVHDPNREDFMHRYLLAYKRAAEDGVDAIGYFAWTMLDNFEWAMGYNDRFGLVYVDYQTQERIVKDSAWWYKSVMESNGETL